MPDLRPILGDVVPLMLVMFRFTGLFVFTPLLGSSALPRLARVLVAISFAVAAYASVPQDAIAVDDITVAQLAPMMFAELFVGIVIGLIASIPLLVLQMAGLFMGYQMGLSLAQSFNPEMDMTSDAIGQSLFYLGIAGFIFSGGLDHCFLLICESFHTIPVGMLFDVTTPLNTYVAVLESGTEVAVRLAAPVFGAAGIMLLAMGLVMKSIPQINIMTIGFSAKIVAGLLTLMFGLYVVNTVAMDEMNATLRVLTDLVGSGMSGGNADG